MSKICLWNVKDFVWRHDEAHRKHYLALMFMRDDIFLVYLLYLLYIFYGIHILMANIIFPFQIVHPKTIISR